MQILNKKLIRKKLIIILSLSFFLLINYFYNSNLNLKSLTDNRIAIDEEQQELYKVNFIVDGDTIHILDKNNNEFVVRFLAVNTNEMTASDKRENCLAKFQKEFTKEKLLNKYVVLEKDETQGDKDKYGRLLRYVYYYDENLKSTTTINQVLIETGNANIYRAKVKALEYENYLNKLEISKAEKLNMWNSEFCKN